MGGRRTPARRSRRHALTAGLAAVALAAGLAACGGDEPASNDGEPSASFQVEVVDARLKPRQRLGETTQLRLAVRNAGEERMPALTTTFSIAGEEGRDGGLPFGIRDPQPDLAQPDRPVWVLSSGYPRLAGAGERFGAETANQKTFEFGPLRPGETTTAIWKLTAVKAGRYRLEYEIGAGTGGKAKAEAGRAEAGGSFGVRITAVPPNTVVTDSGEVVEAPRRAEQIEANR